MHFIGKIIKRLRNLIKRLFFQFYFGLYDLVARNKVIVNYWIAPRSDPQFYNLGDDLNRFLVQLISGKKVIPYRYSTLSRIRKKPNYLCIGSIISQLTNEQTVIWGGGVLSPDLPLKRKPFQVLAVRGPLTRDYLLRYGVECPEVYGDPALLLPNYYQPSSDEKKFRIGIIPHYRDKNSMFVEKCRQENGVCVFDVQRYGNFRSFIDMVCSCELIISSSLHGLIISDAYGIPNVWAEFSEGKVEQFKFEDYFLSVERPLANLPVKINSCNSINDLMQYQAVWLPPRIELDELLRKSPF